MNQGLILFILALIFASCGREKRSNSSVLAEQQKLRDKYSVLLKVEPGEIRDFNLYKFTDHWIGVPYKYGGKDEGGIDCSGFVSRLQKEVYGREVNGPSWSIANNCNLIERSELQEGDLVFFNIESAKISHTGVYLQNNFFVHASSSRGVMVSSLTEKYYMKYFHSAGKPR